MKKLFVFMFALMLPFAASAEQVEILVDFEDDASISDIQDTEEEMGFDLEPNSFYFDHSKMMIVTVDDDQVNVEELLADLENDWDIEYAEINQEYTVFGGADFKKPNDPKYASQWHFNMINMEQAWQYATGKGVVVAVLDTGVSDGKGSAKRVPDLKQACFVKGRNFVDRSKANDPYDGNAHGTHVAGTIAQSTNNGEGVAGMAFEACIMPVKVLSDRGMGATGGIAEGIRWAADNGADVINMSLGGGGYSKIMADAVKYAYKKGVFVACAAGNGGRAVVEYPAGYPGCYAVSAVGPDGDLAFYSSYGKAGNGSKVFIAAPGGDTRVDLNGDGLPDGVLQNTIRRGDKTQHGYYPFQGTSMATPHVAGLAAMILEVRGEEAGPDDVAKFISKYAKDKKDSYKYGAGVIDAGKSVQMAAHEGEAGTSWFSWLLVLSVVGGATAAVGRKLFPKYNI